MSPESFSKTCPRNRTRARSAWTRGRGLEAGLWELESRRRGAEGGGGARIPIAFRRGRLWRATLLLSRRLCQTLGLHKTRCQPVFLMLSGRETGEGRGGSATAWSGIAVGAMRCRRHLLAVRKRLRIALRFGDVGCLLSLEGQTLFAFFFQLVEQHAFVVVALLNLGVLFGHGVHARSHLQRVTNVWRGHGVWV